MAVDYYNPNLFPFESNKLGTIIAVKDGQLRWVQQVNGIGAGVPVFIPPKTMIDKLGIFSLISNLPSLDEKSIMSLDAKDSSDTLLFAVSDAMHLVSHMHGISHVPQKKQRATTKVGWYDPANPETTKFGALDLTYRPTQPVSIARDNVVATQLGAALLAMPGDLIMAAWALTTDFGKVAPLLTRRAETNISCVAGTGDDVVLANPFCVEVESINDYSTPFANIWDSGTYLTPLKDQSQAQILDVDIGAATTCNVYYKTWDLGQLIPWGMMYKCVLGKCVVATNTAGEIIGLEVWS